MILVSFEGNDSYKMVGSLWQYDYGQILRIQGLNLPPAAEIHFSLQMTGGEAVARIGTTVDNVTDVVIPDAMLENAGRTVDYYIYAFVFISDEDSGETTHAIKMRVKSRPKPERVDQTALQEVIRKLNGLIDAQVDGMEYKNNILKLLAGEKTVAQVTIVASAGGAGADAREIELQKNDTAIQWRYTGEEAWTNLVLLADITGPAGSDGVPGKDGRDGADGKDGTDGGYYTPAVSAEGDLSWTASKDGMPEVAGTNIKGPKGDTPVKGIDYFTDEDAAQIAEEAAKLVEIPSMEQLDAEKVFFHSDLVTTHAIGNITLENGQATIPATGKNLKEVWNSIFVQEKNPSIVQPSVSLSVPQAKAYEVGTKVVPSYSAALNPGSYSYGPATGIVATAWEVSDTAGNTANTASGNFPELQVTDGISYKITAKATHGGGAVPVTNIGNTYPDGQIKAGTKSATSSVAITGYRNSFYGTLTDKNDLTSDVVRGLTKSGKALANGNSFTVTVPVGALRVVIAYPAALRDITSIKDVNGMNAEISSGFSKSTMAIEGMNHYDAINYKVYTMDFAAANDTANKLTVTI